MAISTFISQGYSLKTLEANTKWKSNLLRESGCLENRLMVRFQEQTQKHTAELAQWGNYATAPRGHLCTKVSSLLQRSLSSTHTISVPAKLFQNYYRVWVSDSSTISPMQTGCGCAASASLFGLYWGFLDMNRSGELREHGSRPSYQSGWGGGGTLREVGLLAGTFSDIRRRLRIYGGVRKHNKYPNKKSYIQHI